MILHRKTKNNYDYSTDGTLDPWLEGLWNVLMEMYPLPPDLEVLPADVLYPSFSVS